MHENVEVEHHRKYIQSRKRFIFVQNVLKFHLRKSSFVTEIKAIKCFSPRLRADVFRPLSFFIFSEII